MTPFRSVAPGLVLLLALLPALLTTPAVPNLPAHASAWCAWLGGGFLSASLLMTIGAPRIAMLFGGFERMYRWHHALGTAGYVALLMHPLALTLPFLPADPAGARLALASTTTDAAGIVGWLALLGLIVGLLGTFLIRASHVLWRRLHAALAAFMVLGLVHTVASDGVSASAVVVIAPVAAALGWHAWRALRGGVAPGNTQATPMLEMTSMTTKLLVFGSTAIFILAVVALWIGASAPAATANAQAYSLRDVARHNHARDCWMAIDGQVYDLTSYLPQHPTRPAVIVPACGTDATVAYRTKNRDRPHSPYADELLAKYRIGVLAP